MGVVSSANEVGRQSPATPPRLILRTRTYHPARAGRARIAGAAGLALLAASRAGIQRVAASRHLTNTSRLARACDAGGSGAARLPHSTASHTGIGIAASRHLANASWQAGPRAASRGCATRLTGTAAGHAAGLRARRSRVLASGTGCCALGGRATRLSHCSASATGTLRASAGDAASADTACNHAGSGGHSHAGGHTTTTLRAQVARTARLACAAAWGASRAAEGAGCTRGLACRARTAPTAWVIGAAASAAGPVRTGSSADGGRASGCARNADAVCAAPAFRAVVASAAKLARSSTGRGTASAGA